MPLKLNNKNISDVYLGTKKISKIYKGDKLVYENVVKKGILYTINWYGYYEGDAYYPPTPIEDYDYINMPEIDQDIKYSHSQYIIKIGNELHSISLEDKAISKYTLDEDMWNDKIILNKWNHFGINCDPYSCYVSYTVCVKQESIDISDFTINDSPFG